jgi:hypothetical protein
LFRSRGLTRERRRTSVLPRDSGSLPPVHLDHVAGECLVVGTIGHYHRLSSNTGVGYRLFGIREEAMPFLLAPARLEA